MAITQKSRNHPGSGKDVEKLQPSNSAAGCILGAWGKEGGPLGLEAFDGNRIHDVVMSEERYGWPLRKDTSGVKGSG